MIEFFAKCNKCGKLIAPYNRAITTILFDNDGTIYEHKNIYCKDCAKKGVELIEVME